MPSLLTRDEDALRILALNRPEMRNALSRGLRDELYAALVEAADDVNVRAVVLTGEGSAFCSGMDLGELEGLLQKDLAAHLDDSRSLSELFWRLYSFPKPTIAAVNGHAVAGGAGLATLCDVVVMGESAKLGYTEARIGFVAALVGVYLVRLAGERTARELLLEAKPVSAAKALARGLVSEVAPADEVLPRAIARARAMAANSPVAMRATKQLLMDTAGLPLREAMDQAEGLNARARLEADVAEGIRAFLEKRDPEWPSASDSGRGSES